MAEIELGNDWTVVGEDGGEFIIEDDQGNRTKIDNSGNINASALTTDHVDTGSQTIYVRTGGDDANDGLSASNAKETINSAINDIPLNDDSEGRPKIDIGSGFGHNDTFIIKNANKS
jgi:hypothetical protein